eukprot:282945-Prymnesium_polylepis.2
MSVSVSIQHDGDGAFPWCPSHRCVGVLDLDAGVQRRTLHAADACTHAVRKGCILAHAHTWHDGSLLFRAHRNGQRYNAHTSHTRL